MQFKKFSLEVMSHNLKLQFLSRITDVVDKEKKLKHSVTFMASGSLAKRTVLMAGFKPLLY